MCADGGGLPVVGGVVRQGDAPTTKAARHTDRVLTTPRPGEDVERIDGDHRDVVGDGDAIGDTDAYADTTPTARPTRHGHSCDSSGLDGTQAAQVVELAEDLFAVAPAALPLRLGHQPAVVPQGDAAGIGAGVDGDEYHGVPCCMC